MDMTNEDELREQLNEEMAKFEEEGYFKRLGKMFSGLGRPRDSREYKEALIELQRQVAPLSAILLPLIVVIVLFVVTAVGGGPKKEIKLDIVQADQDDQLEEIKPPEEVEPPPDLDVEIQVDTPTVGNPTEVAEAPAQSAEPQSVQVATVDAMLNVKSPVMMKSVFGAERSTGVRGQLTRGGAQYGDPTTEAAVMKALRWLKVNQHSDGSWPTVKPAATGLAILTYLAHGETPSSKEFGDTVQRGLNYLLGCVHEDGSGTPHVRDGDGNEYAFLIATYALCETYGMTKNPDAREVAEKCLERIVKNQSATGGWDYKLNKGSTRDDMSFAGWALQALKAGKMAGIHISGLDECIKKAVKCLKTRNFSKGGFNYTAGGDPTGLTATGCLAMQLLGYMNETEVKAALDTMRTWLPSFDPAPHEAERRPARRLPPVLLLLCGAVQVPGRHVQGRDARQLHHLEEVERRHEGPLPEGDHRRQEARWHAGDGEGPEGQGLSRRPLAEQGRPFDASAVGDGYVPLRAAAHGVLPLSADHVPQGHRSRSRRRSPLEGQRRRSEGHHRHLMASNKKRCVRS